MPRYKSPDSDSTRLSFMDKTITTANAALTDGTTQHIPADLLAAVTAHYTAYRDAHDAMNIALGQRVGETAEANAALDKLSMYISHMWTAVSHRQLREEQSPAILGYYRLGSDGTRPPIIKQQEILLMADALISGDAAAVAAGYAPIAQPTAAELQAVRNAARTETGDAPSADARYDEAQTAVSALRPEADRLIKEVRDHILFSTRNMDASSQRRILRNHGARFYYDTGEKVDDGDLNPEFVE